MKSKQAEKAWAISLRKKGLTYNEVLAEVPVAKSTLSLWLRDVGLSKAQRQRITALKRHAQKKAVARKKEIVRETKRRIQIEAINQIGQVSERDLFIMGVVLYWAEGTKEKQKASITEFCNTDARMIRVYLLWLDKICDIDPGDIHFKIALHSSSDHRLSEVKRYWAVVTKRPIDDFNTILWKKHRIKTNRKKTGDDYYGSLIIRVRKSTNLTRRIAAWADAIVKQIT